MDHNKDIKILMILPRILELDSRLFKSRFIGMPNNYRFYLLATGDPTMNNKKFNNVTYCIIKPYSSRSKVGKIRETFIKILTAINIARKEKITVVIAYDPLTLGFVGVCASFAGRAKLLVEINGHLRNAKASIIEQHSRKHWKKFAFNNLGDFVLQRSSCVKILNIIQYEEWKSVIKLKPIVMYHDFVPTEQLNPSTNDDSFILFVGFPFFTKGVDILISAFSFIKEEFPKQKLIIVGHCREQERDKWNRLAREIGNIEIHKPVLYSEITNYFANCTLFVLPSRSEAMGRVLVEAMAHGKACVGTRVGGIPNIISDNVTGLIVDSENPKQLADALRKLLRDDVLREQFGRAGRQRANTTLSEKSYRIHFQKSIDLILDSNSQNSGIIFSGYN